MTLLSDEYYKLLGMEYTIRWPDISYGMFPKYKKNAVVPTTGDDMTPKFATGQEVEVELASGTWTPALVSAEMRTPGGAGDWVTVRFPGGNVDAVTISTAEKIARLVRLPDKVVRARLVTLERDLAAARQDAEAARKAAAADVTNVTTLVSRAQSLLTTAGCPYPADSVDIRVADLIKERDRLRGDMMTDSYHKSNNEAHAYLTKLGVSQGGFLTDRIQRLTEKKDAERVVAVESEHRQAADSRRALAASLQEGLDAFTRPPGPTSISELQIGEEVEYETAIYGVKKWYPGRVLNKTDHGFTLALSAGPFIMCNAFAIGLVRRPAPRS